MFCWGFSGGGRKRGLWSGEFLWWQILLMLGFLSKFWGPLEWGMAFKELSIFVLFTSFFNVFGVWHWNLGVRGLGGLLRDFLVLVNFYVLQTWILCLSSFIYEDKWHLTRRFARTLGWLSCLDGYVDWRHPKIKKYQMYETTVMLIMGWLDPLPSRCLI